MMLLKPFYSRKALTQSPSFSVTLTKFKAYRSSFTFTQITHFLARFPPVGHHGTPVRNSAEYFHKKAKALKESWCKKRADISLNNSSSCSQSRCFVRGEEKFHESVYMIEV